MKKNFLHLIKFRLMKHHLIVLLSILLLASPLAINAQSCKKGSFLVMFYNVENLFDTLNVSGKSDKEFTPEGSSNWTSERYWKKIGDISKVIDQVGEQKTADIVGLAEVENRRVLEDLIDTKPLKKKDYAIVHHESHDERGIDVAMLYNSSTVKILHKENIFVDFAWDVDDRTRDILYVKLLADEKDTLHMFVNHWKSRGGGVEATAPKRIRSADIARQYIDSLFNVNTQSKIILMGDLNDNPDNTSVRRVLDANGVFDQDGTSLYNLAWKPYKRGEGSYHYWREDTWNMFDQLIISRALLRDTTSGLKAVNEEQCIFKREWILHEEDDGDKVPSKTYGKEYYGGVSDHLPVYFYLD